MLAKQSATTVHQTLVDQGYNVSRSRCRTVRSILFSEGVATPAPARNNKPPEPVSYVDPAREAEMASRNLLRSQLRTGQHWITDPSRFAAACELAGLAA
jgi:hypothetical protein